MPEFKRYPSIESLRNIRKLIEKYNPDFDEDQKMDWIVSEKLHGANVCVSIDENGEADFYSRNGNPLPDGYVYVIRDTIDLLIRDCKLPDNLKMYVYGEIIGPGVQKGVYYGEDKQFMIFDIYNGSENVWVNKWDILRCIKPKRFKNEYTSQEIYLSEYSPPSSKIIDKSFNEIAGLVEDRLLQNPNSLVVEKENNVIEGFVVECDTTQYITAHTRLKFKMVHPHFRERLKSSSKQRKLEEDKVKNDYTIVDEYINENRVQSAISKYPGYTRKQIADVMKEIVNDVKQDMEKDGKEWHIFLQEHGTDGILQVVSHYKNSGSRLSRKIKSLKKSYMPFRKNKYVDGPCFKRSFLRKVKKFEKENHDKRNQVYTDCKVRVRYE